MTMRVFTPCLLFSVLLLALTATPVEAQIWKKVKKAAKESAERTVERKVEEKTENAVEGVIEGAEDAVVCVITDKACIERAADEGKDVVVTDEEGAPVDDATAEEAIGEAAPEALKPGQGAWANYDFVPGERVLFYDDYADDFVGDFPRRLEFVEGNWEVVEWEGRRLLRNTGPRHAGVKVPLPEVLPERFTIETEVYFTHPNQTVALGTTVPENNRVHHYQDQNYFRIAKSGTGVALRGEGVESLNRTEGTVTEELTPIRIMVDGTYAKMYVGERRVANVPNAVLTRSNVLWLENVYNASADHPIYLGEIRIAAGGRQMMYDQLQAEGKVVTRGILFNTGSARLRPESTPTLADMGRMLQQHPDLRLRIEGHTDNTGTVEGNRQLSQVRAEAVKAYLEAEYEIAAGRLEAVGKGQSEPTASNKTAEGRQSNRRVELVRLDGSGDTSSGEASRVAPSSAATEASGGADAGAGSSGIHGEYGDPSRPSGRQGRTFWVSETCDGQLAVGAMWGDVAPWIMKRESGDEFVEAHPDSFGETVRLQLQPGSNGEATSLTFLTVFEDMGRLERLGDLPEGWDECIQTGRR